MSQYIHRIRAGCIVKCLDAFERKYTSNDVGGEVFDGWTLHRLMEDLRDTQSNGHLETGLNTAWLVFRAECEKEPRSALESARRLRSLLLEKYAPDRRIVFYADSNAMIIDDQAFYGFAPEQFRILEYLWAQGPARWTPVRDMIRDIELLDGVSDRTVRRFINDPELCPEIRDLIKEQPGKGHRLILPIIPLSASGYSEVPEPVK